MKSFFTALAVSCLALLATTVPAHAQDGEFSDYPPPSYGGDLGGDDPPPVAPLSPDDEGLGGYWEPPPFKAPSAKAAQAESDLGDPNPGAAISGADSESEEFPLTPPPSYTPPAEKKPKRANRSKVEVQEMLLAPYKRAKPQWAVGLLGSLKALGDSGSAGSSGNVTVRAFAVQTEFQPRIFQKIGVLGIGPTFTVFPSTGGLTSNVTGIWSVAGQVRYQARFFREQPVVPVAAYSMGMAKYKFSAGEKGTVTVSGPLFGLWFLLNVADTDSAASFYANYGVSRSYLIAELHMPSGSDSNLAFSGNTYYFGMRVEF